MRFSNTGITASDTFFKSSGFGLAFVLGPELSRADLLGTGWRAAYLVAGLPGLLVAGLLGCTVQDPARSRPQPDPQPGPQDDPQPGPGFWQQLVGSASPALLLLLIAAMARQTAGFSWAYNTRPFFQVFAFTYANQIIIIRSQGTNSTIL